MAVVISEFEVVPESAPPPAAGTAPPPPAKEPPEVERILAQHHARAARVRAY
jgi:hypothetical protein